MKCPLLNLLNPYQEAAVMAFSFFFALPKISIIIHSCSLTLTWEWQPAPIRPLPPPTDDKARRCLTRSILASAALALLLGREGEGNRRETETLTNKV